MTAPAEKGLTPADGQRALASQGAVNLSGLVHSLAEVIGRVWEEARAKGEGTDYVNQHPIVRLYVEQMYFLTNVRDYHEAYSACERLAGEVQQP